MLIKTPPSLFFLIFFININLNLLFLKVEGLTHNIIKKSVTKLFPLHNRTSWKQQNTWSQHPNKTHNKSIFVLDLRSTLLLVPSHSLSPQPSQSWNSHFLTKPLLSQTIPSFAIPISLSCNIKLHFLNTRCLFKLTWKKNVFVYKLIQDLIYVTWSLYFVDSQIDLMQILGGFF